MNDGKKTGHRSDCFVTHEDPLMLETHDIMGPYYEAKKSSRQLLLGDSLKNITHLKALSTSLQMAISHYALGVGAAMEEVGVDGDLKRFEVALEHHLWALVLARDTLRSRARFAMSSLGTSTEKKLNRLTTRSRDLSVVSRIFC